MYFFFDSLDFESVFTEKYNKDGIEIALISIPFYTSSNKKFIIS